MRWVQNLLDSKTYSKASINKTVGYCMIDRQADQ